MKELTWKPILSNLKEALGELRSIGERLYFLEFGELPEDCLWHGDASNYIASLKKQEQCNPFNEVTLFYGLEHAYHHLNWTWNCRRTPEDRVWHFTDSDASRWTRFPDTTDFVGLWPIDRTVKGHVDELPRRNVSLTIVRLAIYMAQRKLHILCYLVAKELGEDWTRPKGLRHEIEAQPLTEKDFAHRMHRIYVELNMAWNSRRDKTFVTGIRAIGQRSLFPSIFATGCYNMWRR